MEGELIHQFREPLVTEDNRAFAVRVYADDTTEGWEAWIEFHPLGGADPRRTDVETMLPDRTALSFWATSLPPSYLEDAWDRALPITRETDPAGVIPDLTEPHAPVEASQSDVVVVDVAPNTAAASSSRIDE